MRRVVTLSTWQAGSTVRRRTDQPPDRGFADMAAWRYRWSHVAADHLPEEAVVSPTPEDTACDIPDDPAPPPRDLAMPVVDSACAAPPFEQVRSDLARRINDGTLPAGLRLPTVRQFAADLGLAANTVARAYRELEAGGLIETAAGRAVSSVRAAMRPGTGLAARQPNTPLSHIKWG
jgi:hypothetical protein